MGHGLKDYLIIAVALALIPLFVVGFKRAWVPGIAFVLILTFYIIGKPVAILAWHAIPPAFLFIIVALYGVGAYGGSKWLIGFAGLVSVASVGFGLQGRAYSTDLFGSRYQELASQMIARWPSAKKLLIGDIGIVGYRTRWNIVDTAGLVTPSVIKPDPSGHRPSLCKLIVDTRPDVACLKSDISKQGPVSESWIGYESWDTVDEYRAFTSDYVEIPDLASLYGHVYVRRSLASRSP